MISIRTCLFTLALLHICDCKVIVPTKDYDDDSSEYIVHYKPTVMLMAPSFNQSIPVEAHRACAKQRATACPSPSSDGRYACISELLICDNRPDCPGGEDESHIFCFFYQFHERMLRSLRDHSKRLLREVVGKHSHRSHNSH